MAKAGKAPKRQQTVDEAMRLYESAPYTDVLTGAKAPLVFKRHLTRRAALAAARAHYERVAAEAHAAIEAIDGNRVRVRWRRGNTEVRSPGDMEPGVLDGSAEKATAGV